MWSYLRVLSDQERAGLHSSRWLRYHVLMVPGWHDSGPAHWQTHWQALQPRFQRVQQRDWAQPDPGDWVAQLDRAVRDASQPVVLVAHSLGCLTVAPADVERSDAAPALRGFAPIPRQRLPFASRVVASTNDRCCSLARATHFAARWGSDFVSIPHGGHLNADSQLGDWPLGQLLLNDLVWRLSRAPAVELLVQTAAERHPDTSVTYPVSPLSTLHSR